MLDPTRNEMIQFLALSNPAIDFNEFEVAMYWFAYDWHGGQSSNLYSALSTSPYNPGPLTTYASECENNIIVAELIEALCIKYIEKNTP